MLQAVLSYTIAQWQLAMLFKEFWITFNTAIKCADGSAMMEASQSVARRNIYRSLSRNAKVFGGESGFIFFTILST